MSSIQKEQILRVNCPGFGEENYFTVGKARPLDAYKAIVVNPISIFHLFDRDPALRKEIDSKLGEGLTSLSTNNDAVLQNIQEDLKSKRILELVSFLEKGGLLIYYLCRPFLVQGDSIAIDNYSWLESLAPDSSPDDNIRHMSAVSHGRNVETTENTEESGFGKYFAQSGLEWNTIIRTDFLTEGYVALATAGPRKCISGQLVAGDQGGRIIFLPAPYSPDFDKALIECVDHWYVQNGGAALAAQHATGSTPAVAAPAQVAQPASPRTSVTNAPAVQAATTTSTPIVQSPDRVPSQFTSQTQLPAAKLPEQPAVAPAQAVPAAATATAASAPVTPSTVATTTAESAPPEKTFSAAPAADNVRASQSASVVRSPATETATNLAALLEPGALSTSLSTTPTSAMNSLNSLGSNTVTAEFDVNAIRAELAMDSPANAPATTAGDLLSAIKEGTSKGIEPVEKPSQPGPEPTKPDAKPNAADILRELESLSMAAEAVQSSAKSGEPVAPPASALSRNLFDELEALAPQAAQPPAAAPAAPPVEDAKALTASLNQMADSLAAQAQARQDAAAQAPAPPAPAVPTASPPSNASAEPVMTPPASPQLAAQAPVVNAASTTGSSPVVNAAASNPATAASNTAPAAPTPQPSVPKETTTSGTPTNFDANYKFGSEYSFSDIEKELTTKPNEPANHKDEAEIVQATPEAKDLIKKMEEISKTMAAPNWAAEVTMPDVEELKKERAALTESIKQTQAKITAIDGKIAQLESLKNALLGVEGEDVIGACVRIFSRLGYTVSNKTQDELLLSGNGKTDIIAKVVKSTGQVQRSELASLTRSVLDFWDTNDVEPKGILVACTWTGKGPTERMAADFAEGLAEFAQKKSLCLMTTVQLFGMYRDCENGKHSSDDLRKQITDTTGQLQGFQPFAALAAKV